MKSTNIQVVPSPSHPYGCACLAGYDHIANRNAGSYASARTPFMGSNLYGVQQGSVYVVYSYGPHWPLMVYDNDAHCWYTNNDNYSRTTNRHVSHIKRPPGGVHARSVEHLIRLIGAGGVVEAVSDRLALAA